MNAHSVFAVVASLMLSVVANNAIAQKLGPLTYEVTIDGVVITDCSTAVSEVEIPDKIGIVAVTGIGDYAFKECKLTSIVIPEGVTTIGNWAFDGCESITSITLPETVTSIGSGAFQFCYRLSSINLPFGITSINNLTFLS